MSSEAFGTTPWGDAVRRVTIAGGGLTAAVLTYGAVLQDLRLDGHAPPLVLGFERIEHYLHHSVFFGAIVGRYANRIAHGRYRIDGRDYQADRNDRGNTLHGGRHGIDRQNWTLGDHGADFATLTLTDPADISGFPGNLSITCTYRLRDSEMRVELSARTDVPTLCNLAHHSWFNLDDGGSGDIARHVLTIDAESYLPVDEAGIPTGELRPVDGTPFDFRRPRRIGQAALYDHNFCLAGSRRALTRAARLEGARSGIAMEVRTTEPGLQFFGGDIPPRSVPGLGGRRYGRSAGLCLEPQIWPDAPNHAHFPQALLRPGDTYRQVSIYRFSKY